MILGLGLGSLADRVRGHACRMEQSRSTSHRDANIRRSTLLMRTRKMLKVPGYSFLLPSAGELFHQGRTIVPEWRRNCIGGLVHMWLRGIVHRCIRL